MERKRVLLVTNAITETEIAEVKKSVIYTPYSGLLIELSLVHVIPNLPTSYFNIPSMVVLVERYYAEAKQYLNHVGDLLKVESNDQWLVAGKVRAEVLRLANKIGSHFILAGSQHIQELQNSTQFQKVAGQSVLNNVGQLTSLQRVG